MLAEQRLREALLRQDESAALDARTRHGRPRRDRPTQRLGPGGGPRAVIALSRGGRRPRRRAAPWLWPLPTLGVALAVVLGVVVPLLDLRVDPHLPGLLDTVVFNGDADAARAVLEAVAGSLITVTSLTFSLTVVTLQLASSQFSPRLLRTFTQDVFVQVTLGAVPRDLHLRADRAPHGPHTGEARPVRAAHRRHVAFVSAVASVVRAGALPGPPGPADPGRDVLATSTRTPATPLDRVLPTHSPGQPSLTIS